MQNPHQFSICNVMFTSDTLASYLMKIDFTPTSQKGNRYQIIVEIINNKNL